MKSTITLQPCDSSRICAHGYDAGRQVLALQFKDKTGNPGAVYEYANVDPEAHQQWLEAPSKGKFFGTTLSNKEKFPFTKMATEEAEQEPEAA